MPAPDDLAPARPSPTPVAGAPSVGVVIVTRDRGDELRSTLARMSGPPERGGVGPDVPVVVVDNGSSDATVRMLAADAPWVHAIALEHNFGAAGRNVGAEQLDTDLVAFADDDSWWAPGALARAAERFVRHPAMGLLAARVLVGVEELEDPVCAAMAASPYRPPPGVELPGPSVLGFVACGAIVRRQAFLAVGGFHPRYGIGGEEELLALDLNAAGWGCAYVAEVVAHHHPSPSRDPARRRAVMARNELWTTILRRPDEVVRARVVELGELAGRDDAVARGVAEALATADELRPARRLLPDWLERQLG